MNTKLLTEDTMKLVRFYAREGEYPRLPHKAGLMYQLYYQTIQAHAKKHDLSGMKQAKQMIFYCLN